MNRELQSANSEVRLVVLGKIDSSLQGVIRSNDIQNCLTSISHIKRGSLVYIRDLDVFLKSYMLLKMKSSRLVYDFRGLVFAESYMRNSSSIRRFVLLILEFVCYRLADDVCAVSHKMKYWLNRYFGTREVFVFPCLVKVRRNQLGSRGDSSEVLRFVYCGSNAPWQQLSSALLLFKEISGMYPSTLTIISNDSSVQKCLEDTDVKAKVLSLPVSKVHDELAKHDFGFLIRKDDLVNRVSSPIKFLEYLNAGLVPVMSENIGDYSSECEDVNIAVIVSDESCKLDIDNLLMLKKDPDRINRIKQVLDSYSFDVRIEGHPFFKS